MIPLKTPQGQEELTQRKHGLSQRHRTVLLLVDGRRSAQQVLQMALQAGASGTHFDELVALGLVALPQAAAAQLAVTEPTPLPQDDAQALPELVTVQEVDIPLHTGLTVPPAEAAGELMAARDPQLETARDLLIQALRAEAPVTGALTVMKVKRAQSRNELADLLDEAQAKLSKPRKQPEAAAIMRRARDLLGSVGDGDEDDPLFGEGYAQQPAA